MPFQDFNQSIQQVAKHLPFAPDDFKAANALFVRWKVHAQPADKRLVDIWTYCYIRRYFTAKFVRYTFLPATDLDAVISKADGYVRNQINAVKDAEKFAAWLSVVCKNVFIRYFEQHKSRTYASIDQVPEAYFSEPPAYASELEILQKMVEASISKLAPALQEIARLRILQHKEYGEIAEIIGKDVSTIRTYFHKITTALRKDETLLALCSIWWILLLLDFWTQSK